MIGKQYIQTLKLVLTIAVAFGVLVIAQHALAQTRVDNTQVDKFESWDRNANPSAKWITGNNKSYSERDTIPMRLTLSDLIADTAYYFHFCLDIDQTPPWAFTKAETWTTTVEPPPPPSPGDLTMNSESTEGVQAEASNVEGLTVAYLGIDAGDCTSGSRPQLSYRVDFTATAESSIFVVGGHVAAPSDTARNGTTVGVGEGASTITGTFQARLATLGDKTLNFQADAAPLQEASVVKQVIGDNAPDDAVFEISITCGDDSETGELGDGDRLTLDDIPVGTECTADEVDPGEDWTVTIDPEPLTVTVEGPNIITVTNRYTDEYPLQEVMVVKEVIGDNAPEKDFDITIVCEEDSKRRNLWDGDRLTLDDIPVGTECTADEEDPGKDWTVTIAPDPLTVTVDGPNVITVTNLYKDPNEKERPIAKRVKDKKVFKEPMCPYPPKHKHMVQRHKPHRRQGRW